MAAIYPDLQGKVILVTGGASGIGEEIVRAFAQQKARVAFIDIAVDSGRALQDALAAVGTPVHFEHCDLTDIPALRRAVAAVRDKLGRIVVLVNNAAHDERHATDTLTEEDWDQRVAINLKQQF